MRKLTAGATITAGQLVMTRASDPNLTYPVAGNVEEISAVPGQISTTNITSWPNPPGNPARIPNGGELFLKGTDGSLYGFRSNSDGSSTSHIGIFKFASGAASYSSTTLQSVFESGNIPFMFPVYMGFLNNGNILCVWSYSSSLTSTDTTRFAIVDTNLGIVVGVQSTPESIYSSVGGTGLSRGAVTLSQNGNSGFALAWIGSDGRQVRMATYNNSGVIQTTATTVYTRSVAGGGSNLYMTLAELSSGNIVVSMNSSITGGPSGLVMGIVNTFLSVTFPFAQISAPSSSVESPVRIATVSGTFALSYFINNTLHVFDVFSNSGVRQGFQSVTTFVSGQQGSFPLYQTVKLFSDGTTFYLYRGGFDQILRAISSTNVTLRTVTLSSSLNNVGVDIELFSGGNIIHIYGQASYSPSSLELYISVRASDFSIVNPLQSYGTSGTFTASEPTIISLGNGVIATYFWNGGSTITQRRLKVELIAVQGIAWTNGQIGGSFLVRDTEPGIYTLPSALTGTFPVVFSSSDSIPTSPGSFFTGRMPNGTTVIISDKKRSIN